MYGLYALTFHIPVAEEMAHYFFLVQASTGIQISFTLKYFFIEGLISRWTSGTTIFLAFSNICPTAFARIPLLIVVRRTMPERGRNGGQKKKIK